MLARRWISPKPRSQAGLRIQAPGQPLAGHQIGPAAVAGHRAVQQVKRRGDGPGFDDLAGAERALARHQRLRVTQRPGALADGDRRHRVAADAVLVHVARGHLRVDGRDVRPVQAVEIRVGKDARVALRAATAHVRKAPGRHAQHAVGKAGANGQRGADGHHRMGGAADVDGLGKRRVQAQFLHQALVHEDVVRHPVGHAGRRHQQTLDVAGLDRPLGQQPGDGVLIQAVAGAVGIATGRSSDTAAMATGGHAR